MSRKEIDEVTGVETTGHEWDGIKELNTPLPRWWLWTFYATIVWAIGYMILYPAIPLISSATPGLLGYSSRAEVRAELDAAEAARGGYMETVVGMSVEEMLADDEIRTIAISAGAASFRVNCVQCHGTGAQGAPGFPNLNDDGWIWGGSPEDLRYTIAHGVRFAGDDMTRQSEMPSFAGILTSAEVRAVAAHVASLSGEPSSEELAARGAPLYEDFCAACHGAAGEGERALGAPNLAGAIWLYGSTEADIVAQILNPQHGVMPGWHQRLSETNIKELAVYVHSLGGGE